MEISSAVQLQELCSSKKKALPEIIAEYEAFRASKTTEQVRKDMAQILAVMRSSVEEGIKDKGEYAHIVKGYGVRVKDAIGQGKLLGDGLLQKVILYSLAVAQHNASLGRIVACPTAGSCGVVPGALLPIAEELGSTNDELIDALFVMGGVGIVSASQGPISGAEGGCQAECGVASAMAAGAITYLAGSTNEAVFDAASLALQSHLGLVCDPIASLVEVPCVTRNATSAVNAVVASNMVLAGIPAVVPFDETVAAMKAVGRAMPETLRETSQGGLAVTPTGRRIFKEMRRKYSLEN